MIERLSFEECPIIPVCPSVCGQLVQKNIYLDTFPIHMMITWAQLFKTNNVIS